MDVFDAMETCRAIRWFTSKPVSDELIDKVLYAATRAPSPGNSQGWDFVVVTDRDIKAKLSTKIGDAISGTVKQLEEMGGGLDSLPDADRRMLQGAQHLATHLADVPVMILVCGRKVYPPQAPSEMFVWSALYPAAQNILLAARALGLGTCFTTYQMTAEDDFRKLLNLPDDVYIASVIPMGWPDTSKQNFGPLARKPMTEVVHRNGW